jgi:hypothetical protein
MAFHIQKRKLACRTYILQIAKDAIATAVHYIELTMTYTAGLLEIL